MNSLANGSESRHTASTDSYALDVYHPVLRVGDRKLISQSATLDESLLDHVLLGGGVVGGTFGRPHIAGVAALRFEIDMALFADGELGGPDTDNFAAELHCRKPAAQFIATQIRSAKTEGRDVTPVLSALLEMPQLGRPDDARAIR